MGENMLRIINTRFPDSKESLVLEEENGIITRLGVSASDKKADREIDAEGALLMPGLCDVHSHFRDPGFTHKEDIMTGAKCAARGGYTDIVMMANTKPAIDNTETLKYVLDKGKETGIRIHSCATVTMGLKGETLTDMAALKAAGAVGFTDDGIPVMDEKILRKAFETAAALGLPVSLHEEDKSFIKENGINHGKASEALGIFGSPREAEASLIKRDIDIAAECGVRMEVQHISSKEGVKLVRDIRKKTPNIYAEVTPHHLALTEEAVLKYGANAKMNPPLRTEEDRQAIIEGIKDGTITIVATDHAPHAPSEKEGDILKAPSGIIGLETAFTIAYDVLVRKGILTEKELIAMFTDNPRALYGLPKVSLNVGEKADFTLFAPDEDFCYDKSLSKSQNSPFLGQTLKGKIKYTVCEGRTVYEDI